MYVFAPFGILCAYLTLPSQIEPSCCREQNCEARNFKTASEVSAVDLLASVIDSFHIKMAAIYGMPTNSSLSSPDRAHHMYRGHAPSSSPPTNYSPLNPIPASSQESQGPPRKRARITRSSTLSMAAVDDPDLEGTSPARPITIDASDRSASPATPLVDGAAGPTPSQSTKPLSSISTRNDKKRRSVSVTSSSTSPQDSPTYSEFLRQLSLFVKLSTWTTAEGLKICGICQ
jgi:hypothetical protein